jgi:import inner membrane translocase subunit TIM21
MDSGSGAPEPRRRAVTPFNDNGNVPWAELSAGEKTGRAAQQTFNFGMVVVGVVLTVRPFVPFPSLYL